MNVLHINQSDIVGGAGIAAFRLHQGLVAQGLGSKLLVGQALTNSEVVATVPRKHRTEKLLSGVTQSLGLNYLNYVGSFKVHDHPFYRDADIVNFHNLHNGYFSYLALPKLTGKKLSVLTLHDMWSFTGHCANSLECERWKTGCGSCPHPNSYPAINRDNTRLEWRLKDWTFRRSNLRIVAPSKWLAAKASQSMLSRFPIHHIPNGIETDIFQPLDKRLCRSLLGIEPGNKVIMFGAHSLSDSQKGGDLLTKALGQLPTSLKADTVLLTLGKGGDAISRFAGIRSLDLGYLTNDRLKSVAYSAADLFVHPTRADNLPLVLQESMGCGTPMVSFDIGGVSELVRPGITGYLAEPENPVQLARHLTALLEDDKLREQMGRNSRHIAVEEYNLPLQVRRYVALYQDCLTASSDGEPRS